jgi:antitoxin HicB
MKTKKHIGSTLESFFEELGELEEVKRLALKKGIAATIEHRASELQLSKGELAEKLKTSRSQLDRLLNPNDTSVTLRSLVRVATALDLDVECALRSPSAPVSTVFLDRRCHIVDFTTGHRYAYEETTVYGREVSAA